MSATHHGNQTFSCKHTFYLISTFSTPSRSTSTRIPHVFDAGCFFLGFSVMGSDVGHIDTTDPLKTAPRGGRCCEGCQQKQQTWIGQRKQKQTWIMDSCSQKIMIHNLKPSQAEASSALFLSRKPRSKEAVPCAVPPWRVMASPKEEISWGDAKGALEAMPSCKDNGSGSCWRSDFIFILAIGNVERNLYQWSFLYHFGFIQAGQDAISINKQYDKSEYIFVQKNCVASCMKPRSR